MNKSFARPYEIPLTPQFDTFYNRYQRLLAQSKWDTKQNPVFSEAAHQLYQYLLEKPLQDFKTKHLILLPDDKLASFSFAALFTRAHLLGENHNEPYLIHEYSVHTAYTLADLGMENADFGMSFLPKSLFPIPKSPFPIPKYFYAGFSHDFNFVYSDNLKTKGLDKLLASKAHIEQINHLCQSKGQTFINTNMNLAEFKKVLSQSRILELISHADFDEHDVRKTEIAFPNAQSIDWLEINDIYNLNCIGNELLMLIACKTGKGLPIAGETVISMAYAFAYSGVQRRVSALWSIKHQPSMELMETFFQNLLEKQPPAIALQQAQIQFLKSDKPASEQMPNLWAGLVHSGNWDAISN